MTRSALLGSGAAFILAIAATPGFADDSLARRRGEIQTEIRKLEAQLNALEAKRAGDRRVRRRVAAAAVERGARPRSWKLPGTNTSMQIGGYAQLDLIYDINHSSGDGLSSNGASSDSFPSTGSAAARRQGNFGLHARRSRFFIRTWTPTEFGTLQTQIEVDFFGDGGNQLISNSNSLRIRHAYGSLGPVLAGQTNSNYRFTNFEMTTFEDRGLAGNGNGRQGQIRYTRSFGGGTSIRLSVENPELGQAAVSATYLSPAPVSADGSNDPVPDFTGSILHKWSSGLARVGFVVGYNNMDDGFATSGGDVMWGIQGAFKFSFNNKRTTIAVLGFFGKGAGKYHRGMPAGVAVTGVNPSNVNVRSIRQYGGYAWIQHKWSDTISTNVGFGRHDADVEQYISKANTATRTLDIHWSFIANLVWQPVRNVQLAFEYHYVKSQFHNANSSTVNRIQLSGRYYF